MGYEVTRPSVAQKVEQLPCKHQVVGSIPTRGSILMDKILTSQDLEIMFPAEEAKQKLQRARDGLLPSMVKDVAAGDVPTMLQKAAPIALVETIDLMLNARDEKLRASTAKDVLYMAGHKPVEKSISIFENIDRMSEKQMDAFLLNHLGKLSDEQKDEIINLIQNAEGTFEDEKKSEAIHIPEDLIPEDSL